jgi:hypothetical protein
LRFGFHATEFKLNLDQLKGVPPAIDVSKIKYATCVRNEDEDNVILGTAK